MLAMGSLLVAMPAIVDGASATYEYDVKGRVSKITYDDGTVVAYAYDANGNRTGGTNTQPPPDTTPPTAPGTPTFSNLTMTSATASWTAATDNKGIFGYDYKLNAGAWVQLSNVLSVNLASLSPGTSYTFQVRARDAASNLGPASSNTFATPDTVAPTVPTGLSGSAPNSSTVNLTWNASTDNVAVTGYRVYRGGSQIGTSATTSYSDPGRTGSTTYSYQVAAYDAVPNVSALTAAINVTTPDTIAPTTPTSLSATAINPTRIDLSWGGSTDSGGSGLAGYRIYRGGSQIATTTSTSYSDTTVSGGTSYSYNVAAYDNAPTPNISPQSNTANATTLPAVTVSVSNGNWRWRRFNNQPTQVDPPDVCSATGGTGTGYTFHWQYVSGDTATNVNSPNSSTTIWSRSVPAVTATYSSTWVCIVTDSAGNTGQNSAGVTFIRTVPQ